MWVIPHPTDRIVRFPRLEEYHMNKNFVSPIKENPYHTKLVEMLKTLPDKLKNEPFLTDVLIETVGSIEEALEPIEEAPVKKIKPVDCLDYDNSELWNKVASKRFKENEKIINKDALWDLYRRNYAKQTTVTPKITLPASCRSIDDYIDEHISKFYSAFELLPHSERFMDLVLQIYCALSYEAYGEGEVVVTNKKGGK